MFVARVSSRLVAAAALLAASPPTHGHMMLQEPPSRSFDHSRWAGWSGSTLDDFDSVPFAYAAGGVRRVVERAKSDTPLDALEEYGGGDLFPLLYTPFAENGNYLEPNTIANRHSICGGPRLGAPETFKPYSTYSSNFEVLRTYVSGQTVEMDAVVVIHHWGHVEMSICDTSDESLNPGGIPTQECFNRYPLTRDPNDDSSPIDPDYPGRYYVQPPCRANETSQAHELYDSSLHDIYGSYRMLMKYKLPEGLTCTQCILQMHYLTGHICKHIGYDDFEPPSWPGTCAPTKEDWIIQDTLRSGMCGSNELAYPEEFWNCSDIEIVSGAATQPPSSAEAAPPTPSPVTPAPVASAAETDRTLAPGAGAPTVESSAQPTLSPESSSDAARTSGTSGARPSKATPPYAEVLAAAAAGAWAMCFTFREAF